jgi:methionine-rich copper-binding protein CopC
MRSFSVWLLFAVGLSFAAPAADAHAKLIQSSPAAGSIVDKSLSTITLKFNEAVAAKLSRLVLATLGGDGIATGPIAADANDTTELVVTLTSGLPAGKYHVSWSVVSADMHKVAGTFDFEVKQ